MKDELNILPPFYIGQRVIAIRDHSQGVFKKGDKFTITSVKKSRCKCQEWVVNIGIKSSSGWLHCKLCGYKIQLGPGEIEWDFKYWCFAPLDKLGEFVSMKQVVEESMSQIGAN